MIDFDSVARASDDFWYDHEFEVVRHHVANLSPTEWGEFQRQCLLLPFRSLERMAYVLGDIDTISSAHVLLQLCKSKDRDTVLTAREALRSLSFDCVKRAASDLWPSVSGRTVNDVLDEIEGLPG